MYYGLLLRPLGEGSFLLYVGRLVGCGRGRQLVERGIGEARVCAPNSSEGKLCPWPLRPLSWAGWLCQIAFRASLLGTRHGVFTLSAKTGPSSFWDEKGTMVISWGKSRRRSAYFPHVTAVMH